MSVELHVAPQSAVWVEVGGRGDRIPRFLGEDQGRAVGLRRAFAGAPATSEQGDLDLDVDGEKALLCGNLPSDGGGKRPSGRRPSNVARR